MTPAASAAERRPTSAVSTAVGVRTGASAQRRLEGRRALITGAGSGIGAAGACLFAEQGARVLVADVNEANGMAVAQSICAQGGEASFLSVDVTDEESVRRMAEDAWGMWGGLDVLYCNAGGSSPHDGRLESLRLDVLEATLRLNLTGTLLCCRELVPRMARNGGGAVITTTSVVALMGLRQVQSYTAAKGAIAAVTRSMAVEYASDKVRVNAIAPTSVLTERTVALRQNRQSGNQGGRNLLGDLEPIDVAYAAVFLASDESRYITGQVLAVDSGLTIS